MVHLGSSNLENSDGSACDQLPTGEKYSTDCFACTRPLHARRSTNNAFGPRANAVSTAHQSIDMSGGASDGIDVNQSLNFALSGFMIPGGFDGVS
jgi:hypothetical protein